MHWLIFEKKDLCLKGGGDGKITADFSGQIVSLSSVKTESIIFKIVRIGKINWQNVPKFAL